MGSLLAMVAVAALFTLYLFLQNELVSETGVFYEPVYFTPLENQSSLREAFPMDQLNSSDVTRLIDITDFSFTMKPSPERDCGDRRPLILALIHSAPLNFEKRIIIRNSWLAHRTEDFVGLFLIGQVSDHRVQKLLRAENELYGDLVQGNFKDSYHNMTYKHVMVLKYVVYHCQGAKYVVKTDDDVSANVPYLRSLFETMSPYGVRDLLLCNKKVVLLVLRSFRSKWRVSFKEYPEYKYPEYCRGDAVIYSPDVVFRIYKEVQKLPFFWIDDVHVSGTAAKAAKIRHTHFLPQANPFVLLF